jgi:hypothetical protein
LISAAQKVAAMDCVQDAAGKAQAQPRWAFVIGKIAPAFAPNHAKFFDLWRGLPV